MALDNYDPDLICALESDTSVKATKDFYRLKNRTTSGFYEGDKFWSEKYLWEQAKSLPLKRVLVKDLLQLRNSWTMPTLADIVRHMYLVQIADLSYPILLRADGTIFDGYHRACKAGMKHILELDVKQFITDPPPEKIISK
jgi:hypothetical protein